MSYCMIILECIQYIDYAMFKASLLKWTKICVEKQQQQSTISPVNTMINLCHWYLIAWWLPMFQASGDFNAWWIEEGSGQREGPRCPWAVCLSRLNATLIFRDDLMSFTLISFDAPRDRDRSLIIFIATNRLINHCFLGFLLDFNGFCVSENAWTCWMATVLV